MSLGFRPIVVLIDDGVYLAVPGQNPGKSQWRPLGDTLEEIIARGLYEKKDAPAEFYVEGDSLLFKAFGDIFNDNGSGHWHRYLFGCPHISHLLMASPHQAECSSCVNAQKIQRGPSDHNFIQPFLRELSKMTPTRKAAPMFHMAKAATISIT
jgi:hypothetical protein